MSRILIVDDEAQVRKMLARNLRRKGFEVETAENGAKGMASYKKNPADLLITDLLMPDKEGLETIHELKNDFPDIKIIAISGGGICANDHYLKMAKLLGANKVMCKPMDIDELIKSVEELLGSKT